MLPGKVFRPEDVLRLLRRRVWFLLVPFAVVAAATTLVSRKLPEMYKSETLILVVPQRVPENYVKATVTSNIADRLPSISQQILSRSRLERIMQEFNLYAEERKTGIMEDIVEKMRKDITADVVKGDAFRVSYIGRNPRMVMKVTERLSTLFIDENLRDRTNLAEGTDAFLEKQLEDAGRRLTATEKQLEEYRKRFAGQLPSQLPTNVQVIQGTSLQLQQLNESLNHDRDRHIVLERELNDLSAKASTPAPADNNDPGGGTPAQQLATAKAGLAALMLKLKPEHPDIKRANRLIAELQEKADQEASEASLPSQTAPRAVTPTEIARANKLNDVRSELEQLDRQIAFKQSEDKRLRSVVGSYQQRVEAAPTRESEMAGLTRDYATLQTMYQGLLEKKEQSKIAANLERQQNGQQFKLLDPARLPERPFSPNRRLWALAGMIGGIAIGAALIALLEYRDQSFRSEDEVASLLGVNVLAVVPAMQSDPERRKQWRRTMLIQGGLSLTVAGCLAVVAYSFIV